MLPRSRAVFSAFCLLAAALCCIACRARPNSTIAVIPRDSAEEIWVSEHGGTADAAYHHKLDIDWSGPTRDDDVEQQISLSEAAVRAGDYGLILSPNNSFALDTVIQRALAKKMPVVILGSPIPIAPQRGLSFVLNDSEEMGTLAAKRAAEILHGKGQVLVLGVDSLSPGSVERADAFERALHQFAPAVHVVEEIPRSMSFGQAELASEQAIAAHPGLSAIFAVGINETRGAAAAVHNGASQDKIKVIGCDQTIDLLFLLRRGGIDSLVIEDTRTMGNIAVHQIVAERHGQTVPERRLVDPVLVTRANVDQARIQQILSLRWRPAP
ncbi:MAG: substrate-binding domain-containing protein [Acidobacteriaceae bacterium]